jgi:4-hydroxyphenylacetate 3-monooxygenase
MKALEITGVSQFRGVQARLGEVLTYRNLIWALTDAMARDPMPWVDGYVLPNLWAGLTYRVLAPEIYPKIKDLIERDLASALIYLPAHAKDFQSPEIRPYLDKYVRGNGVDAVTRVKVMKALWDAVGTEFGGRHELYERNYAGNHENIRIETLGAMEAAGVNEALRAFADRFLAEYDLEGWKAPDLFNPEA